MPLPHCSCSAAKSILDITSFNDAYDHVRNQILVMDPIPSVNKACSMILHVEKWNEIHISTTDTSNSSGMLVSHS